MVFLTKNPVDRTLFTNMKVHNLQIRNSATVGSFKYIVKSAYFRVLRLIKI